MAPRRFWGAWHYFGSVILGVLRILARIAGEVCERRHDVGEMRGLGVPLHADEVPGADPD